MPGFTVSPLMTRQPRGAHLPERALRQRFRADDATAVRIGGNGHLKSAFQIIHTGRQSPTSASGDR